MCQSYHRNRESLCKLLNYKRQNQNGSLLFQGFGESRKSIRLSLSNYRLQLFRFPTHILFLIKTTNKRDDTNIFAIGHLFKVASKQGLFSEVLCKLQRTNAGNRNKRHGLNK